MIIKKEKNYKNEFIVSNSLTNLNYFGCKIVNNYFIFIYIFSRIQ